MKRKLSYVLLLQVLTLLLLSISSSLANFSESSFDRNIGSRHQVDTVHILGKATSSTSEQGYLQQIHAQEVWDSVRQIKHNVVIALLDTGVDLSHPDLSDIFVEGANLLYPKIHPFDDNGHGTNVAGVIAAIANNHIRSTGSVKIMPIKVLDYNGSGDVDKLAEGFRYAIDHGAKIIVCSMGLNYMSENLIAAVQYAERKGILVVAAAGNEGKPVKYPAAYPTVLSVGGATADNNVHPKSNFGPELDVIAPWYDTPRHWMGVIKRRREHHWLHLRLLQRLLYYGRRNLK